MHSRTILPLRLRIRPLTTAAALLLLTSILAWTNGDAAGAQSGQSTQQSAILDHLNAVIGWYRHTTASIPYAGQPSDAIYQSNARSLAAQAVQKALQSAKAEAVFLHAGTGPSGASADANAFAQRLQQQRNDVSARIETLKSQLASLNAQLAKAPKSKLQALNSQRQTISGALNLNSAILGVFDQASQSVDSSGENTSPGLEGSIAQLERSVPELAAGNQTNVKSANPTSDSTQSQGLLGEAITLYQQLESMHQISQLIGETGRVRAQAVALEAPLLARLRDTLQQSQNLAGQVSQAAAPGTPTPGAPPQPAAAVPAVATREHFDALAASFKQVAAASLPLREEIALLDQSRSNLVQWHDTIEQESVQHLGSILLRVAGITIAICVVLLLSEMWRRITFRYIHDMRRRRQFLLLRRIVVGFCMTLVLTLGFVSEFSSLATFAGFITAGLAVGLQTILLSVAAYFFLVGKWGIRVGDRISVAGVTGDVVDVGLVRLYLMELAGTGIELYPTGRVVVIANSVMFQATTPLFKQLPGADYTWHEVAVVVQPGADYKVVEEKILAAVNSVYQGYRDDFVRQHGDVERRIEVQIRMPEPHGQLQYADGGLELVVRYPVGLDREAEIDGEVTRKLLELGAHPDLKSTLVGFPKIRAAIKG
jgi:small-conductance mechanosensitive channel